MDLRWCRLFGDSPLEFLLFLSLCACDRGMDIFSLFIYFYHDVNIITLTCKLYHQCNNIYSLNLLILLFLAWNHPEMLLLTAANFCFSYEGQKLGCYMN